MNRTGNSIKNGFSDNFTLTLPIWRGNKYLYGKDVTRKAMKFDHVILAFILDAVYQYIKFPLK